MNWSIPIRHNYFIIYFIPLLLITSPINCWQKNCSPWTKKNGKILMTIMITNLFSIFDPASRIRIISNWTISCTLFRLIRIPLFLSSNQISKFIIIAKKTLIREIHSLSSFKTIHISLLLLPILTFIIITNLIGLFPYNFTPSRHIRFTLTLAAPIWLTHICYSIINNYSNLLSHLVPNGTPTILIPFIVVIETIRNLIRPLTLAIRLAANIIAGHLLLALLSSYASIFSFNSSLVVLLRNIPLLTLELAVALIQRYVFMVLITLYSNES